MNSFNDLLIEQGIYLQEEPVETDPVYQGPTAPQQDTNTQAADVNQEQDANTDAMGTTDQIATPSFTNEEIGARIEAIKALEDLLSLVNKINSIREFGTKFNINEFDEMIKDVLNKVNSFSTLDLFEFKNTAIKKLKDNLFIIKNGISTYLENKYFSPKEEILLEDIFNHHNITLDLTEEKAFLYLINALRKKLNSLDDDSSYKIYSNRYDYGQISFILRDTIDILIKLRNKKLLKFNKSLELVDEIGYSKKNNVVFINKEKIFDLVSLKGDKKDDLKILQIFKIPTDKCILEFACLLRLSFLNTLSKSYISKLKYYDSKDKLIAFMISSTIQKCFKVDNSYDKIMKLIQNHKLEQWKMLESLDNFKNMVEKLDIEEQFNKDEIELLRMILAAFTYLTDSSKKEYIQFDKVFVSSYTESFQKYISLYVSDIENIYCRIFNNLESKELLFSLHAFSHIQSLSDLFN